MLMKHRKCSPRTGAGYQKKGCQISAANQSGVSKKRLKIMASVAQIAGAFRILKDITIFINFNKLSIKIYKKVIDIFRSLL